MQPDPSSTYRTAKSRPLPGPWAACCCALLLGLGAKSLGTHGTHGSLWGSEVAASEARSVATTRALARSATALGPRRSRSGSPGKEYQVKMAFLYNFAKYTTWPKSAFKTPGDPIIILIVGDDPFGAELDKLLAKKTVAGRSFKIVRSKTVPKTIDAHIVFSKDLDKTETKTLIKRAENTHALLVGDDPDFATKGGMIGFYKDSGKVRFEVNSIRHKRSLVTLSPELLKVARVVKPKDGSEEA